MPREHEKHERNKTVPSGTLSSVSKKGAYSMPGAGIMKRRGRPIPYVWQRPQFFTGEAADGP